jgi:hypothetical protein
MRNIFDVFGIIVETQAEMGIDVETNHPNIGTKKEFTEYKRHVEILRGLLGERKNNMEALLNLLAYEGKAVEASTNAVSGEGGALPPPPPTKQEAAKETKKEAGPASVNDWEGAKVLSTIPDSLQMGGQTWLLIDQIDILDKDAEEKHALTVNDAKDTYRTRQKLKYPDGTVVEDTGRAHVGGYCSFKVLNVTPGRPLIIIRRMDYVYGDYELEVFVNNKSTGVVNCAGTDRINRWRNWPVLIPAEHVTDKTLTIKQVSLTAGRDVNMFHFWFFQPK